MVRVQAPVLADVGVHLPKDKGAARNRMLREAKVRWWGIKEDLNRRLVWFFNDPATNEHANVTVDAMPRSSLRCVIEGMTDDAIHETYLDGRVVEESHTWEGMEANGWLVDGIPAISVKHAKDVAARLAKRTRPPPKPKTEVEAILAQGSDSEDSIDLAEPERPPTAAKRTRPAPKSPPAKRVAVEARLLHPNERLGQPTRIPKETLATVADALRREKCDARKVEETVRAFRDMLANMDSGTPPVLAMDEFWRAIAKEKANSKTLSTTRWLLAAIIAEPSMRDNARFPSLFAVFSLTPDNALMALEEFRKNHEELCVAFVHAIAKK